MNINQLMKQAQAMQKKLNKVQNAFNGKVFSFENAEKTIKGQMKGNMEIVGLQLDEALLKGDKAMLEGAIVATLNQARQQIADQKEEEIGSIAGNVSIPNLL